MGDDIPGLRLRQITPADGPAVARLFDASPDNGMIRFRPSFQVDPYVALMFDGHQRGVVAERDGSDDLLGIGLVELGDIVLRGHPSRYALMHSLVVHPDARRQGVAAAIVDWRLARAREALGDDGIIVATIQKDNEGSFALASRWATGFSSLISSVPMSLPSRAPAASRDGLRVRQACAEDLERFADGHAAFHADFDLWPPGEPSELAAWLDQSPDPDTRINALWIVEETGGTILAGLGATEVRRMTILQVEELPTPMRLLNMVLRVIPKGGTMQMIRLSRMWFQPDAETAARHLFEVVRWETRQQGNVAIASFDPRGPLSRMVAPSRWLPRTAFSLAMRAPEALRPDHPIEPVQ